MATVFLAQDTKHRRPVALKVLHPALAHALGPERFRREVEFAARLQHPHILTVFDSGEAGGYLWFTMPFVEGESLRERMRRERQLPVADALQIAREVADALRYAHDRQIIHRDIKPENILLQGGHAFVADFGIARALSEVPGERLTETGLAVGTPYYMSPEQAAGDSLLDGRSDIYALACVLYEMLAGEPPFTGPTAQALIAKRVVGPIPLIRTVRPTVPVGVEQAISRALSVTPADRYGSAAEFAAALLPATRASSAAPLRAERNRWRAIAGVLGLVALGIAALRFWPRSTGATLSPSASVIAVLPFAQSGSDTALSRLGRDLVFTLSAELDGLGPIRVVDAHTVLAHSKAGGLATSEEGAALARRFGAGSIVHGSLVREGSDVRLDFTLLSTDSAATPLARASVAGAPDSIALLTDSAVHQLLRQIWTPGSAPTPSLDGALRTRSVAALRDFLAGEQEIVSGRWDEAAASYARAREGDPTFWQAYAREAYALQWSLVDVPDTVLRVLDQHRQELPEAERLSIEADQLALRDSIGAALERSRSLTAHFPSSWFGWLVYADQMMHNGPLLGFPRAEARAGFERALDLNPNLMPVHEHLMLLALLDRDTAASARELAELTRLHAGPALTADGYGTRMLQFRFLSAIARGDSAEARALTDSIARDPAPAAIVVGSFYDAYRFGFYEDQIRVSQRALRLGVPPANRTVLGRLLVYAWAGRGAFDSALVAMDRQVASGTDSAAALRSYGLAVVGAWLGAVDPGVADPRRAAAAALAQGSAEDRGEVAWLDGLLAVSRKDRKALAEARAALKRSGDPAQAVLDRSLAAFDLSLGGNDVDAGRAMAALEWNMAAVAATPFGQHVYVVGVDRLAAGRWLAASDPDQALRLLTWVDGTFLLQPSTTANIMLTALAEFERGRIEEKRGKVDAARSHYREFLRRYDRPPLAHRAMVQEARMKVGEG